MKNHGRSGIWPLFAAIVAAFLAGNEARAQVERGFVDRVFKDADGEHKYVVFVPPSYTPERPWPVILFLHGAGERGNDGKAQVSVGLGRAIQERADNFPCITVFPQCEDRDIAARRGWLPETADGKRALAILNEVEQAYNTDKDRIYLTGLSMGGFGAWAHAAADPGRWAALVPICGGGTPATASGLTNLPIWCFHGADDRAVPADESRRMIAAVESAGGKPRYTEFPGVGHNSWDSAYSNDELYTWLFSQRRGQEPRREPVVARPTPLPIPRPPANPKPAAGPQDGTFVPALEIPDAVYVRLGNEMLAALADSIPSVMPANALSGSLPDVQQITNSEGSTVQVQFSGVHYSGKVTRVLLEAQGEDRLNVTVLLRNVNLVFDRTYLSGDLFSATCGPLRIVLGNRSDLPLAFQVRPVLENSKLRLKLLGTQFRLDSNNWSVGNPEWVNIGGMFGAFVSEGRVTRGLRDGIYRDSSRIEREVAGAVPRMLSKLENRFTLEPTDQIVDGLWPLPVYKPAIRTWPSFVRTDATGITVALGVSVGAYDPRTAPAQPRRIELPGAQSVWGITGEKFQIAVAPELIQPLSAQVVADDAARASVTDMPMEKLQPLGDVMAMGAIVPDLKQRGDREIRTEMRLISPLRLTRAQSDSTDTLVFELPRVRCAISVHPNPTSQDWVPYLDIDFSLRQAAQPTVSSPVPSARMLTLNWQGDASITVEARFAPGYSPSENKIDNDQIQRILSEAWSEWTATGSLSQVSLEDLDLGYAKLRADKVEWSGAYLATTYAPAGILIRNLANQDVSYEMKGPYSEWGGPYKLEAGAKHQFSVAYPVTSRFTAGADSKMYTLPAGSRFEFQRDSNGLPDLYISRDISSPPGAVSMNSPVRFGEPDEAGQSQSATSQAQRHANREAAQTALVNAVFFDTLSVSLLSGIQSF